MFRGVTPLTSNFSSPSPQKFWASAATAGRPMKLRPIKSKPNYLCLMEEQRFTCINHWMSNPGYIKEEIKQNKTIRISKLPSYFNFKIPSFSQFSMRRPTDMTWNIFRSERPNYQCSGKNTRKWRVKVGRFIFYSHTVMWNSSSRSRTSPGWNLKLQ